MFVKMYWPTEALVGLWPLLNKGVYGMWTCDTCARLFWGQADLTKFRGKKVNEGYSIAKPSLMGGDPGSSRVEVGSTGFYIILISIDYFSVLRCDLEIVLYEAYLFFIPRPLESADHACFHHLDPKVVHWKWVAEVLVKPSLTNSAPFWRCYFPHSIPSWQMNPLAMLSLFAFWQV